MGELVRTNDPVLLAVVQALLEGEGIPCHVADRNMSVLEGSVNFIQQRVLVPDELEANARELLVEAELGEWLMR
ncbi:DUF2007 domain-containing protein [Nocardioides agariphilus]|uniref:DUF2007 domain-containing protein n=1 Tax=Nocardioides agariphilus TaxID=433664 RepID=A0A930VL50_9ACTN|nr:DUF2007 domain-containing protein [Nocardioides agariphilus]MBF4769524.1 DUF2007 domain-containing protein [Nocardioides agariphilus]